jgi:TetR/AcrR family transcriptional regulator
LRCRTFYRYFSSKDELLLAVVGDAMVDACERWAQEAAELPDPLARLRFYVTSTLERLSGVSRNVAMTKFVVSTRWRLHKQFPKELAEAEKPFVDLLRIEIDAAIDEGLLNPPDPEWVRGSSPSWSAPCTTTTRSPRTLRARSTSSRSGCGSSA